VIHTTFKVKGQGHQAALFAVFARQAAALVGVGTCWPWETAALLSVQGASAPTREGGEERGHIVAAARLQLEAYSSKHLA